jgi:uncharacterized membrane protein (DUF2068 family)
MSGPPAASTSSPRSAALPAADRGRLVYILGIYMLAKAAALFLLGHWVGQWIGSHHGVAILTTDERIERLRSIILYVHLDPDGQVISKALKRLIDISPDQLRMISYGSYSYAVLHLLEGIGLVGRWRWGEWMVVVSSSALIPFEVYEFLQRATWMRVSVIAVNVAIVLYFNRRLRLHAERSLHLHHHRAAAQRQESPARSTSTDT